MRVFVTGASGHIGSAVVTELIKAGHKPVGLARSEASAAAIEALGAEPHRGDLTDHESLRQAAREADAVIHLAFDHAAIPQGRFAEAAAADVAAVTAMCDALVDTGKAFIAVGVARSDDPQRQDAMNANPRVAVWRTIEAYADRGVRAVLVAVPNVTHSERDQHGFVPQLIRIARETGVSGYVADGANTWAAGHTLDVARVFALAVDKAPAGAHLVAAAEPAVPVRTIAESIAQHLGIEAVSIPAEDAAAHFQGFPFITMNVTMPDAGTRALLDWQPTHPDLLTDMAAHYFDR
ncbi:MAG TPA: SDR family NAD(P)-dependent oxidoreductase [Actinospica sp.]|nr:SDR family NAD(P)-dependent oxidoreductase [Actinospica sp.]